MLLADITSFGRGMGRYTAQGVGTVGEMRVEMRYDT